MILKRKLYSAKGNLATKITEFILKGSDKAAVGLSKAGHKKAAKNVAKSFVKGAEKRKIAEIRLKYKNNPKIAEQKITRYLEKSKHARRIDESKKVAAGKLENLVPTRTTKSAEEISSAAEKITAPGNIKDAVKNAGRGVVEGGKSIARGLGKVYTGTGKVLEDVAGATTKHPISTPLFMSGDVINAVGPAVGHPEVVAIPFGTIGAAAGLGAEKALFPRAWRRKMRQAEIKLRKSSQQSGFRDWSLQKTAKEAGQYTKHLGVGGHVGNYSLAK